MKLMLIRHADPDYVNDSLMQKGHEQAERLGQHLASTHIDELYVSPMGRAQITAGYIVQKKTLEPITLDWLHELNGNYEGKLWAWNYHGCDIFNNSKITLDNWIDHVPYGKHMQKISAEFYGHFDDFMKEQGYVRENNQYSVNSHNEKTIVFVCHAGVILTLLSHLLHIPLPICYSQFGCDPSSCTILEMDEKGGKGVFRMIILNDMSHARDLLGQVQQTGAF